MGAKTKIDWCDATWNPVTGCLHGCEYCYARRIAERFGGSIRLDLPPDTSWRANRDDSEELKKPLMGDFSCHSNGGLHVLDEPALNVPVYPAPPSEIEKRSAPYPYFFDPTFHRYKLDQPQKWTKPRTIFVCSMADLFGEWVPGEWIREIVAACDAAPQHRYLFLTKNPSKYKELDSLVHWPTFEETNIEKSRPYMMLGASATNDAQMKVAYDSDADWVSIEPIHERLLSEWFVSSIGSDDGQCIEFRRWEWVVIGAETGNRKDKIIPKKEWIQEIADICLQEGTPVFMKESLRGLMGSDFKQEFPWEV